MKIKVNEDFLNIKQNYLFSDIAKKVSAYSSENPDKKIIRLGIGDVTRPLAPIVISAMHKAADEMANADTFRGYAPEPGYDFIRKAVADYYGDTLGVKLLPEEVFVGDGAKSDVGNLPDILGNNHILIPDPVYPVYLDSNLMAGRDITFINANLDNGFLPLPDKNLKEKPYVIYLCSPNNPTGAVYNREQLKDWVDFALKTGSLIVFDCAYEAFIKGDYPHSIYEIEGARECAVEIGSLSKMAGFTGMRCGWSIYPNELTVGDKRLSEMWSRRQSTKFNGVPYVIQRAAEAAFSKQGIEESRKNINYYIDNAQMIANLMKEKDIFFTGGENSPYVWLKCPTDSWSFFDFLLKNVQVVGTPGAGFGKCGEGFFRLSSFGTKEATVEAIERLKTVI